MIHRRFDGAPVAGAAPGPIDLIIAIPYMD
jgi:hypothetical protein